MEIPGASPKRSLQRHRGKVPLAITYRSWEVSWGPWASLLGCAWHWSSSSVPARLRTAAWLSWRHLSSLGPGDTKGKGCCRGGLPRDGPSSTRVRATRFLAQASYSDSPQELPRVSPHAGTCDVPVQSPSPITTAAPSLLGRAAFPSELSAPATQFTARSGLVKILHCLFSTCHPFVSPVLLKF